MTDKVFLIKTKFDDKSYFDNIYKIINETNFYSNLEPQDKVSIKIHLRDIDDSNYINIETLDKIKNKIESKDCDCKIISTDTLYHKNKSEKTFNSLLIENSLRSTSDEHITKETENNIIKKVPILKEVNDSDAMIIFSHFKGHSMIGFSGALKNTATGCTTMDGQIQLHKQAQPFISKISCLACKVCLKVCPIKAITLNGIAQIDKNLCTGCNTCIDSCPKNAIKINKITSELFIKCFINYTNQILKNKKNNKVLFINNLISIKPYYDYNNKDKVLCEDIGILASYNPVALDMASYDLVNQYDNHEDYIDKFKEIWRNVDGVFQIDTSEELKIGTRDYEIVEL